MILRFASGQNQSVSLLLVDGEHERKLTLRMLSCIRLLSFFLFFLALFFFCCLCRGRGNRKYVSHSMTQGSRNSCVAVLTTFIGGVFSPPSVLPTLSAPNAWSSSCVYRASIACHHFVSISMRLYIKCAAIDALLDLPPPLFLGAPMATSGSTRFSHTKGHKRINKDV